MMRGLYSLAGSVKHPVLVFCVLLLVASVLPLQAQEQIVRVQADAGQNGTVAETGEQGIQQVLAKGVLQEALQLLPGGLSRVRTEALVSFLSARAQEYVLSYSQGRAKKSVNRVSTIWRVAVNREKLKDFLKSWGLYFTVGEPWPYTLELQTKDPQADRQAVGSLETLSGLSSTGPGGPRLVLKHSPGPGNGWKGRLEHEDRSWTREGSDLEEVWLGLWSSYFSLEKVQALVLERLVLRVHGFSSITGVQGIDRVLSTRFALVDQADLMRSDLLLPFVSGTWKIRTPDPSTLNEFLNRYLTPRGLDYNLTQAEKKDQSLNNQDSSRQTVW